MEANALAKEASASESMDEFDKVQYMLSVDLPKVQQIEGEKNWMAPIVTYLKDGRLLEGKDEARRLRIRSTRYVLMNEMLYKRDFS